MERLKLRTLRYLGLNCGLARGVGNVFEERKHDRSE